MEIIEARNIVSRFGSQVVHNGVSFAIRRGTITAIIGGSGTGKTVLLKEMIGLRRPDEGQIFLFGESIWEESEIRRAEILQRVGVLFQNGALFSGLNVGQNVAAPMIERGGVPSHFVAELVKLKLSLAGLGPETVVKMPSELSGGMRKRVALARALALEPELLFLDEPTSGLDPIGARNFDRVIRTLCDGLNLTIVMNTHDLDSIELTADRIIVLASGRVIADGSVDEVKRLDHPWIREYFESRARPAA